MIRRLSSACEIKIYIVEWVNKEKERRDAFMDIGAIVPSLSMISMANDDIATRVLSMGLDDMRDMGDGMRKMLEMSVTPHIGGNIDISV